MLPIIVGLIAFIVVAVQLVRRVDRAIRRQPAPVVGPRLRLVQRAATGLLFALALLALSVTLPTATAVQLADMTIPHGLTRWLWAHHAVVVISSVLVAEPLLARTLRATWANLCLLPRIAALLVLLACYRLLCWRLRRQLAAQPAPIRSR